MSSLSEEQRKERRRQQSRESRKRLKTAKEANKVRIEDLDAMKLSVANLEEAGALKDTRIILLEAENTLLKEMQVLQARWVYRCGFTRDITQLKGRWVCRWTLTLRFPLSLARQEAQELLSLNAPRPAKTQ